MSKKGETRQTGRATRENRPYPCMGLSVRALHRFTLLGSSQSSPSPQNKATAGRCLDQQWSKRVGARCGMIDPVDAIGQKRDGHDQPEWPTEEEANQTGSQRDPWPCPHSNPVAGIAAPVTTAASGETRKAISRRRSNWRHPVGHLGILHGCAVLWRVDRRAGRMQLAVMRLLRCSPQCSPSGGERQPWRQHRRPGWQTAFNPGAAAMCTIRP